MFFLVPVSCSSLSLSKGGVDYNKDDKDGRFYVGTKAYFWCNSGYYRSGDRSRTCQSSGNWNGQTPTCKRKKRVINQTNYFLYYPLYSVHCIDLHYIGGNKQVTSS